MRISFESEWSLSTNKFILCKNTSKLANRTNTHPGVAKHLNGIDHQDKNY